MSTAVENTVQSPSPEPARLQRPARTLIGWMRREEAKATLAGLHATAQNAPEYDQIIADARATVSARPAGVD